MTKSKLMKRQNNAKKRLERAGRAACRKYGINEEQWRSVTMEWTPQLVADMKRARSRPGADF